LEDGWKENDVIYGRFCKQVLRIPRSAANGVAEMEMVRDSRIGEVFCLAVIYWLRMLQMGKEKLVRCCEWQLNNLKSGSCPKKLKKELDEIGLVRI
jgi:hypothetical protein